MEKASRKLFLKETNQNRLLIHQLRIANTWISRMVGLLSVGCLSVDEALWIRPGWLPVNSIHTFFMRFSIDCIFLNSEMEIVGLFPSVGPWKILPPIWEATSVVEMSAGQINNLCLKKGDVLYVGS